MSRADMISSHAHTLEDVAAVQSCSNGMADSGHIELTGNSHCTHHNTHMSARRGDVRLMRGSWDTVGHRGGAARCCLCGLFCLFVCKLPPSMRKYTVCVNH